MKLRCKNCGSPNLETEKRGTQTGIYCCDCGYWLKWASKEEVRMLNCQCKEAYSDIKKFKIIDKNTGKEPTTKVILELARSGNLIETDIDQFAVCEDGQVILLDDCGNMVYCDRERFTPKAESEG